MPTSPTSAVARAGNALRTGRGLAVVLTAAALMMVVGGDWGGQVATYLPCRRNWGWLPSYQPRVSPIRSATTSLGTVRIKVCYGAPESRGRRMLGGSLVPFGRLWRTGANEPTTLRLGGSIVLGGITIGAGKVSLYTIPGPETWELIINRSTSQWGLESEYVPSVAAQEIGRVVLPSQTTEAPAEEQLRFAFEPGAKPHEAVLVMAWETTRLRIPVRLPP